jgi:hypothetical protein
MNFSLKVITPPAIEPVSVDEVKLHTRINYDVEDSILSKWISTAREMAEDYQRRAFISQMLELSFDNYPVMPIRLPRPPLIELKSIKIYDYEGTETVLYNEADNPVTTTTEGEAEPSTNADFIIDTASEPGRIGLAFGKVWPATTLRALDSVKIRYAAGYGLTAAAVPACVADAIMLYCAYRNENRAAEEKECPEQFYNLLAHNRMHL